MSGTRGGRRRQEESPRSRGPPASSPKAGRVAAPVWADLQAVGRHRGLPPPACVARPPKGTQARREDWAKLLPPSLGMEIRAIWQVRLVPPGTPQPTSSCDSDPAWTLTLPCLSSELPVPTSSLVQFLVLAPNPPRVLPVPTPQSSLIPAHFLLPSAHLSPSPSPSLTSLLP